MEQSQKLLDQNHVFCKNSKNHFHYHVLGLKQSVDSLFDEISQHSFLGPKLKSTGIFFLFYAGLYTQSNAPSTELIGKSWCPDCRNSIPHVQKLGKDFPVIYVDAGMVSQYKVPTNQHIYRAHQLFSLKSVPTLTLIKKNGTVFESVKSIGDSEMEDVKNIESFFKQVVVK